MIVLTYSSENLAISLSNQYTSSDLIKTKNHFTYLSNYLSNSEIDAKLIIIEEEYISKDYLHDYASYYALCFEKYPKFCKRVHFFNKELSTEEIDDAILGKNDLFKSHYLGFIVVKPIPYTIIGYTVLRTYNNGSDFNNRHYWGLRNYKVHVFGNELSLRTLAFQEQDSVLAACATTAIWSMLNKAAVDFHTILKSPNQITKDADNLAHDGSRLFPNKVLDLLQICKAILNSGLVSEVKGDGNPVSNAYLKKIINAYSTLGIPLILVIAVPLGNDYGLHAVAITGYKQKSPEHIAPGNTTSWLADNIEKIYAHDDQFGPFVRIDFDKTHDLITEWTSNDIQHRPTHTSKIIVSLFPKIRLTYEDIHAMVLGLDVILTLFFGNKIVSDLIWDIKLLLSEDYKQSLQNSSLDESVKISKLTKSLPKYIWVAKCYIGPHLILEFSFDATNVSRAMHGIDLICYLPNDIKEPLIKYLSINEAMFIKLFKHVESAEYYKFFQGSLTT